MKQLLRVTRRTRMRLVLLAVLSLLFQQVAVAAYACSTVDMPVSNAGMTTHCDAMPMTQQPQNQALCPAHCAHQALATQDVHAPTVPFLPLPAVLPAPMPALMLPAAHAAHEHAAVWRPSGIPPALRFRVLLI